MPQPHIVLLGPTYPYRGGNALFMSHLYAALSEEYRVDFVNYKVLYPSLLFPGSTPLDKSATHFRKVPSERLINSMNPLTWVQAARHINRLDPDLVAFDWYQPFFGPSHFGISSLLRPELKKKLLFITENLVSHESRTIDRALTRMGLAHARRFLTLSEKVAREIREMFGDRYPIYRSELPAVNYFDSSETFDAGRAKRELGFQPDDRVLLFFGYVRRYKGLDILIDAFAQLAPRHPDLKLLVAGEFYEDEGPYRQQVKDLGLEDRVVMDNRYIPNEAVGRYLQLSEVLVMPYRSATQSGIQALAHGYGKPIVLTDVGGLRENLDDGRTGIVVPAPTPQAVAEGVERYFELSKTVDFTAHIRERVSANRFNDITRLFGQILQDVRSGS